MYIACEDGERLCGIQTELRVYPYPLPRQEIVHTEWFHADCIADYYRVTAFGEEHWGLLERFIQHYAERSMNMILTPIHTPPLDTGVGEALATVQLVERVLADG